MTGTARGALVSTVALAWAINLLPLAAAAARAQAAPTTPVQTGATEAGVTPNGPAQAAPQDAKPTDTGANQVEEIVVTGSALPTTPDAVAVPVEVIGSDTIAKGGVSSNALEILRKEIPAFQGRGNAGASNANNTNQNTAGGSQAQVRNLDTLVLINGRRASISAVAGIGGKAFVDVNQIPAAAIERVEVLPDGASAIYGSDAIGGVVNFILKDKYEGVEVGGRYAGADGGYIEKSGYVIAGHEIKPGLNVTFTGTLQHTDPLYQNQRSFSSPFFINTSSIPGTIGQNILASGLVSPSQTNPTGPFATAPNVAALVANGTYVASNPAGIGSAYDLSQFQTLLQRQDLQAFNVEFNADLFNDGRVILFGGVEYSDNRTFTQFLPRIATITVPKGAAYNPIAAAVGGVNYGDTLAPKQYRNDSESLRATLGLRGQFNAFDRNFRWEAAYVHSQDILQQQQNNVLYSPNLALAVAGGFDANGNAMAGGRYSKVHAGFTDTAPLVLQPALDPFARFNDQNALNNVLGVETINARSILDSIDGQVTSSLFDLPAGPIGIAVGGGWRRESLSAHADDNGRNSGPTAQRWIGGQFYDPFTQDRTIASGFAEARAPITSPKWNIPGFYAFDLIAAGRVEDYSDAGSSVVPKVGFRWEPLDPQVVLRGTYAESFTAPTLYAEAGPTGTRLAGGTIISNAFPGLPANPFPVQDGNNPNLQPSHSRSYSAGVTITPRFVPGLKVTGSFFSVNQTGFPGGIGFSNILLDVNAKGSSSLFYNNIAMNNFPGLPGAVGFANPGDLRTYLSNPANAANTYAIDRFTNLGGIKVRSVDMSVDYTHDFGDLGVVSVGTSGTYLASYKFQVLPSQKYYEYAGTATNAGTGVQGTLPDYRFYSTLDWSWRNFDVTLGHTFISSVVDLGVGGLTFETNAAKTPPTAIAADVASYSAFDIRVAYKVLGVPVLAHGVTLAVGVNNIGDETPPIARNAFTDNHADVATYSPVGRLVYATIDAKF